MARNLTGDSPPTSENSSPNPFSSREDNVIITDIEKDADQSYPVYPRDVVNGTNSNLLSSDESSYGVSQPSEFDRFPSKLGSRVVSSSSLSTQAQFYRIDFSEGEKPQIIDEKYDFSPFGGYPASAFPLNIDEKEPDDYLHNPDPIADAEYDKNRFLYDLKNLDKRSIGGLFGVLFLFAAAAVVFILIPVLTYSNVTDHYIPISYEILTQYEFPLLSAIRTSLIDPDTPVSAQTHKTNTGDTWNLVFSDEFNVEGRTFYEGDDQFFTAPDIWYGATKDLEWYDPDAVTTSEGTLTLTMDAFKNHNLFYRSGMIQSWNKLCFTQGMIKISAQLPNYGNVTGLWPGIWTLGNLGRPGYMASTEGVWPYTYDSCDAGISPNQSSPDGISFLPGQKLNSCTCKGSDHPNVGIGRGAPEIDVLEAEADTNLKLGVASQSFQIAPFDIWYMPDYSWVEIYNTSLTTMNTYTGGPFQQAVSGITTLNTTWYERGVGERNFQEYGFEYLNDNEDGYITWYVGEDPTYTLYAKALAPNGNIGWRRISKEPMSIIINLGISNNWAYIDWQSIMFPVVFKIDNVRIYQPSNAINLGCDPPGYPTYDYIEAHKIAYHNANYTHWKEAGYSFPKNSLLGQC